MHVQWIRVSCLLKSHPKVRKLGVLLQKERVHSYLVDLWSWAAQFYPSGDLSEVDELDIALGAGWENDPAQFVTALERCGFIEVRDSKRILHDWEEYQGRAIEKMERDRERKRKRYKGISRARKSKGDQKEKTRSIHGEAVEDSEISAASPEEVAGTRRDETRRDETKKNKAKNEALQDPPPQGGAVEPKPNPRASPPHGQGEKASKDLSPVVSLVPRLLKMLPELSDLGITGAQLKELESRGLGPVSAAEVIGNWKSKRRKSNWENPTAVLYTMLGDRAEWERSGHGGRPLP